MFSVASAWQKIGLVLLALSIFVVVVACPVILWLIRQTNIATDLQDSAADEQDLFTD
jgi:hypothetical protein